MFVLLLVLLIHFVFVVIVFHWDEDALVPFGMLHLNNYNKNNFRRVVFHCSLEKKPGENV